MQSETRTSEREDGKGHPLTGKRVWIPRMSTGGARVLAATLNSLGVNADVSPESDEETLRLASRFTTGEECLPQRVTLGNFLKIIERSDFDASRTAFFLPTSAGPCRFGQYAPLLRKILKEMGHQQALVFSPTSSDGYEGIAGNVTRFRRSAWRAVVVSDILRKMTLMFRPYERDAGTTDRVHTKAIDGVCRVLSDGVIRSEGQMRSLRGELEEARDAFLHIPRKEALNSRPLVGAVGEIYLRFNDFSNQHIIRRIEGLGGEVWIAGIGEWVWYTNSEEKRKLRDAGRRFTLSMAFVKLRHEVQAMDERRLTAPVHALFSHRSDPRVETLLAYSKPYLPAHMALGEMTLNTGNAVAFYHAGCDGVVDISPFTCMNGIVTEVVYPVVSRQHNHFPIRIFYFDGVPFDLDGDLEIFFEQIKAYRKRKGIRTSSSRTF